MATDQSIISYRDIPGFQGYRVGDDGSVWSCWRKRGRGYGGGTYKEMSDTWTLLKISPQRGRSPGRTYLHVRLTANGKSSLCRVHRLVLLSFVGPCPEGFQSRHLDGNPQNNTLLNLRWGTPTENTEDKRKQGRHTSKARFYAHEGETLLLKDWARRYGIPYLTLWNRLNTGIPFAEAILLKRYDRKGITRSRQP